ncbi:MAG: UbiX family flavin prenyltransferase [Candidatus Hydrothermarchaeales archaeon]
MKVIVAITGASGAIYGIRLMEALKDHKIKTECIVSKAAKKIILHELGKENITTLKDCHSEDDIEASTASGSFKTDAMVIAPCSMKTLSAVANGFSDNLISRSADVMIKEGRKLILVPRETPLSAIHLQNMLKLAELGVVVLPAMPGFYHKPKDISDMVDFVVGKILDSLDIQNDMFKRWGK